MRRKRNSEPTRDDVLKVAVAANLDPRSARKALVHGPDSLRGDAGIRAAKALAALGLMVLMLGCGGGPGGFIVVADAPVAEAGAALPTPSAAPTVRAPADDAGGAPIVAPETAPEAAAPAPDAGMPVPVPDAGAPEASAPEAAPRGGSVCPFPSGPVECGGGDAQHPACFLADGTPYPNDAAIVAGERCTNFPISEPCNLSAPQCPSGWMCYAAGHRTAVCP